MGVSRNVLVIDDDTELCELLHTYLTKTGFKVEAVHDGETGVKSALSGDFDFIVLDVMLPNMNGFDVLRQVRSESEIPVLMLTARDEDIDRIVGLELGADDYLPKPFNPRELAARIKAILRRAESSSGENEGEETLRVGDVVVDFGTRVVTCGEEEIELTTTEFALLEVLLRSAGKVVKREELSAKALGRNLTRFDRSIDVQHQQTTQKIGWPFRYGRENSHYKGNWLPILISTKLSVNDESSQSLLQNLSMVLVGHGLSVFLSESGNVVDSS